MQVCPIISGWSSETRVGQKLDRGQRRGGQRGVQKDRELVRYKQCNKTQIMQRNTIIGSVCIKEDTVFKYRRFGKQGVGVEEDIGEQWG